MLWLAIFAGGGTLIAFLPIDALAKTGLVTSLLVCALGSLRKILGPGHVCALALEPDAAVEVRFADGKMYAGKILGGAVYPWAIFLRMSVTGRRRSVSAVLWRDSLDAESFRQARVWFRDQHPAV